MMEQIIRVNKINVKKNLCVVDFYIDSSLDMSCSIKITHSQLYELLSTATKVTETKDYNDERKPFVTFEQGIIEIRAYVKEKASNIH